MAGLTILAARAGFLLLALLLAFPATAAHPGNQLVAAKPKGLTPADRAQIQRVITLQLKAFERSDDAVAFSYSTPETRKYFGSARDFMAMVRADYAVLYNNASRKFLDAAIIDGQVIQPLQIVSREGETLVALFAVERQPNNEWRIAGCELAPSTLQST